MSETYDAFISYSRANIDFARALEATIEKYKPPKSIMAKPHRLKVFRDEKDLIGADYYTSVEERIGECRKLIVIASPESRNSGYVNDEIRRFAKKKGAEHIITILLDGIPNNEVTSETEGKKAFPEALIEHINMPLAIDYKNYRAKDKLNKGYYENAWYTLLSNMLGTTREEVEQRERRRTRNIRIITSVITTTVIVVLTAVTIFSWIQKQEAESQRNLANKQRDINLARLLGFQGQTLIKHGIGDMASRGVLLGIEGARSYPNSAVTEALQLALELRGEIVAQFSHEEKIEIEAMAFNPKKNQIVTASYNKLILWDILERKKLIEREVDYGLISHLDFDASGDFIAMNGRMAYVWDIQNNKLHRLDHKAVGIARFDRSGKYLATGDYSGQIKLWSIPQWTLITTLEIVNKTTGNNPDIETIAFHPKRPYIAMTTYDGTQMDNSVYIWSIPKKAIIRKHALKERISSVEYNSDGTQLIIGTRGLVHILDGQTGRKLTTLGNPNAGEMVSTSFSDDDRYVAAVEWDGPGHIWEVHSGKQVRRLEHEREIIGSGRVSQIRFSPDDRYVATLGKFVRIWRFKKDEKEINISHRAKFDRKLGEFGIIAGPGYPHRGEQVNHKYDFKVHWDQQTLSIRRKDKVLKSIVFPNKIRRVLFSKDSEYLSITDKKGMLRVFDSSTLEELVQVSQPANVEWIAINKQEQLIGITGMDKSAQVFSLKAGEKLFEIDSSNSIQWIGFSSSGKYMLTSTNAVKFEIIDLKAKSVISTISHDRAISEYLFTKDEQYLATASDNDGSARIWSVASGTEILNWYWEANLRSVSIGFDESEKYFFFDATWHTGAYNSRKAIWRSSDLTEAACKTVTRNLYAWEWEVYFPPDVPYKMSCSF